jgi:thiol-disulfide isomerase/thioredoxin
MLKVIIFITLVIGVYAQDFTFKDVLNQDVNVTFVENGLKINDNNKSLLLVFFGKTCPPCLMEIPHLVKLQKEKKNLLDILSLQVQKPMSEEQQKYFIKANNINYQVVDTPESYPFISAVMQLTGWKGGIPFAILFDKNGNFLRYIQGMVSYEDVVESLSY